MLKHKVYYYSTYNVDGYDNDKEKEQSNNEDDNSTSLRLSTTSSNATYSSYSSSGSYSPYSEDDSSSHQQSSDNYSSSLSSSNHTHPYDLPSIHPTKGKTTAASNSGHVEKKDWNREFQALIEQADSEVKFKKLSHLARDFVHAAQSYAVIIINELCLPDDEKTIKVFPPFI